MSLVALGGGIALYALLRWQREKGAIDAPPVMRRISGQRAFEATLALLSLMGRNGRRAAGGVGRVDDAKAVQQQGLVFIGDGDEQQQGGLANQNAHIMAEPLYFSSPAEFRDWLALHAATTAELIVGFHKVGSGLPSMTWPQSVDEALCFGWIDGVRRSVDELRYQIRFTPRRAGSIWSAINIARVE
eukprot:gene16030-19573_t